jgi:flagellar biosynthesis protein
MANDKSPKKAVALKYNPDRGGAPRVAAKGRGRMAAKIIDTARKHGIPVKDDPDLVEVLAKLDVEQEIPPELYLVVAELLAFVYSINGEKGGKKGPR